MNKLIIMATVACLLCTSAQGQKKPVPAPLPANTIQTRQVVKTIYIVDTTEYYKMKLRPEGSDTTLAEFLFQQIKKGQLTAYANKNNLSTPLTRIELFSIMNRADTIEITDPVTGATYSRTTLYDFNFDDIRSFNVLEDWRYDKQRGTTDIQIVAIAPVQQMHGDHGPTGTRVLYWLKYADVKKHLATYQQEHPNTNMSLAVWNQYFTQKPSKN